MRAIHNGAGLKSAKSFRLTVVSRFQLKRAACRALTAACLLAVLATGCATGPSYSIPPLVGIVSIPPPHRNYLERLASLDSDKDGGVLYWATYGHWPLCRAIMAMAEDGYDTTGLPTADPNTLTVSDDVRMRHLGHLHETAKLPTIQEALPPFGGARW